MDELDRILRSDEIVAPPPRFTVNVMVAVRASARPSSVRIPWWPFVRQVVASGGIVAAGLVLASHFDVSILSPIGHVLAPVATELASGAAIGLAALGAIHVQRLFSHQE